MYENMNRFQNQYLPRQEVPRVSGREGAMSYSLGPNSSVLLLDNDPNKSWLWLVTSDSACFKQATPFEYFPVKEVSPEDKLTALEASIKRLEERLNESYFKHGEQSEPDKSDK